MRFLGRLVATVVILATAVCASINMAIHVKSGEAKELFAKEVIEAPAETPAETPAE